jgi:uncharacterized protein (TIGR00369 family)
LGQAEGVSDPQAGSFDAAEATERLQGSPLHRFLGFRAVEIALEKCVLEMPIAPDAFGGTGNLHGGALATLIDVTSAMAASRANPFDFETHSLVTADLHVRYLGRPSGGDSVRAEAKVVRAGRMLVVVETRVLDINDKVIATGDFSSMLVPRRQPLLPDTTSSDPEGPEV